MKICLIIPPSLILSDERTFMHLGPLRVAGALKENNKKVDVLDLSGVKNYLEVVENYVDNCGAENFGITATSPQMPPSVEIVNTIKKNNPKSKIVLGGPHVTLINAARKNEIAKNNSGRAVRAFDKLTNIFDTLITGDGEFATLKWLENQSVKLIDADDPKSPLFLNNQNLNLLPFPARELVDVKSYKYFIDGERALSMIAQLGCPFHCGFCGGRESPFLRRVRLRTTDNVILEMRHIFEKYGIKAIMFYDDELNVNKQMVELMRSISKLGKELGIEWKLRGFIKAELFTDEQAEAMYDAGFREILIGFESGSPLILKNIQKGATKEDNTRCVKIAKKHNLRIKALMSIGHPGENETTIKETEDWITEIQPESFDMTRITVYPGTPYFDHATPHSTQKGVWTYKINGSALHSREVDFLSNFLFYKGDRGDRMGLNQFFAYTDFLSVDDMAKLREETEKRLREKLGQPYQADAPTIQYEHSMGQGLPENILRSS